MERVVLGQCSLPLKQKKNSGALGENNQLSNWQGRREEDAEKIYHQHEHWRVCLKKVSQRCCVERISMDSAGTREADMGHKRRTQAW